MNVELYEKSILSFFLFTIIMSNWSNEPLNMLYADIKEI